MLVLADDLGYVDPSIQGHPLIRTPDIDRLARQGQRWTSFYASAPCNPSRVALVTGRLPIHIHRHGLNLWEDLPDDEVTIVAMLKERGYAAAYVGKWGLSSHLDYRGSPPSDQGFDHFSGLVGSNDAPLQEGFERTDKNVRNSTSNDFPISLCHRHEAIETPAYQPTLAKRYTEESVRWIRERVDEPLLPFLAHTMPHAPLFRSAACVGHSEAGLCGDVIEKLDWSVG